MKLLLRATMGRPHVHGEGDIRWHRSGPDRMPLTLFLMFFSASRGVPEAGLTFAFAFAMVIGAGLVLCAVAIASVWARDAVVRLVDGRGIALNAVIRWVYAFAGIALLLLAASELIL